MKSNDRPNERECLVTARVSALAPGLERRARLFVVASPLAAARSIDPDDAAPRRASRGSKCRDAQPRDPPRANATLARDFVDVARRSRANANANAATRTRGTRGGAVKAPRWTRARRGEET